VSRSKKSKHQRRLKNDPRYRREQEKLMKQRGKRTRLEEQPDLWELSERIKKNDSARCKIVKANEGVSQGKQDWLKNRAEELNRNLPKSERWFLTQLKKFYLHKLNFIKNFPLGDYIFDLKYKELLIEIDGSIHDLPNQKEKDRIKSAYVKNNTEFTLIRVKAYDEGSLNDCIEKLLKYRAEKDPTKH